MDSVQQVFLDSLIKLSRFLYLRVPHRLCGSTKIIDVGHICICIISCITRFFSICTHCVCGAPSPVSRATPPVSASLVASNGVYKDSSGFTALMMCLIFGPSSSLVHRLILVLFLLLVLCLQPTCNFVNHVFSRHYNGSSSSAPSLTFFFSSLSLAAFFMGSVLFPSLSKSI